jgi:hypothetical protein
MRGLLDKLGGGAGLLQHGLFQLDPLSLPALSKTGGKEVNRKDTLPGTVVQEFQDP